MKSLLLPTLSFVAGLIEVNFSVLFLFFFLIDAGRNCNLQNFHAVRKFGTVLILLVTPSD